MTDAAPRRAGSGDPTARIRQAILDGAFSPNERLVEADLVRHYGSTRTAIRLALAVLEQQGLVTKERNRGARVRLISAHDAIEINDVRGMIEALLARHAAERCTAKDARKLRGMLTRMEALAADGQLVGYSEANVEFHAEIARLAHHPTAERILNGLRSQTVAFQFRPALEPGRLRDINAEHRTLVAAIAAGDGPAAEAAMRVHIDNVGRALAAAIAARRVPRSLMSIEA